MIAILGAGCAGTTPEPDNKPVSRPINTVTLSATPPSAVVQDPHQAAAAAFGARNYRKVLALMEPLAAKGDPRAEYIVGYLYFNGFGVDRNQDIARRWIEKAAAHGNGNAISALEILAAAARREAALSSAPVGQAPAQTAPWLSGSTLDRAEDTPSSQPQRDAAGNATSTEAHAGMGPQQSTRRAMPFSDRESPPAQAEGRKHIETEPAAQPQAANDAPTVEGSLHSLEPAASQAASTMAAAGQAQPTAAASPPQSFAGDMAQAARVERRSGWILAQPADNYTIQLMTGVDEKDIIRFIEQHDLAAQAAYFAFEGQERPWYAVIYGSYPGFSQAQQSLANLPAGIRTKATRVRDFAGIQRILITGTE